MFFLPLKDNLRNLRFPLVTVLLITLNFVVFGWELSQSDSTNSNPVLDRFGVSARQEAEHEYGAIPYRLTHPGKDCAVGEVRDPLGNPSPEFVCEGTDDYDEAVSLQEQGAPLVPLEGPPWWQTVFTSMFLHAGWIHILGNMLFLWIFGNNVESAMGRLRFLSFYLLAGIVAVYTYALLNAGSDIPEYGASGAIAGVLGAYLLLYPRARILTFIFILFFVTLLEIPALIILALWFVFDALPGVSPADVAWLAHLGGFAFGLLVVRQLADRKRVEAAAPPAWV